MSGLNDPTPERTVALSSGWTIHVHGEVDDDLEYAGGHASVSRLGSLPGGGAEELRAAVARQRQHDLEQARTPVRLRVRLTRGSDEVTVFDEERLPGDGVASLGWPAIVVPEGVVLRWSRITTSVERVDGRPVQPEEAPHHQETEVQRALLVSVEGELLQLPFELAVPPLAVAPDGRILLPSGDPLWWDDDDSPLTLLALDGATEPLLVGGEPVTPSRVLEAIGEPSANRGGADAAPLWTIRQARFDAGRLLLRLPHEAGDERECVAVELPLAGRFTVRRLGTTTASVHDPLPPL